MTCEVDGARGAAGAQEAWRLLRPSRWETAAAGEGERAETGMFARETNGTGCWTSCGMMRVKMPPELLAQKLSIQIC